MFERVWTTREQAGNQISYYGVAALLLQLFFRLRIRRGRLY
jgi:hypothetical protein